MNRSRNSYWRLGLTALALAMMGGGKAVSAAGLEDLLWAVLMSPEFQYIR